MVNNIEQVVLLDERGTPIGQAPKESVHSDHTPLHLAFSCYLTNTKGELLVTRRALSKLTWPGVWTNSFCGHPAPGENLDDSISRRAQQELGADITSIESALPNFRYRAVDASGVVENEVCPVFTAQLIGDFLPNPAEVADWAWVPIDQLSNALVGAPFAFSPWLVLQFPQLVAADAFRSGQSR